jgi:hypothetical protein
MSEHMLEQDDPNAVHLLYVGDGKGVCGQPLPQGTKSTTDPVNLTCSACNGEYWTIMNEEEKPTMSTHTPFTLTDVPVRAMGKETCVVGYGALGGPIYTWFGDVTTTDDETDAWKVTFREYDEDNDEYISGPYTINHEKVIETALKIAADTDLDLDVRAKYLGWMIDPENWDTQLDVDDIDYLLQIASWGEHRYN